MTHHLKSPWQLAIFSITALVVLDWAAPPARADGPPPADLLDHFFHPIGLMLSVSFMPPPGGSSSPSTTSTPNGGDPSLTIQVPPLTIPPAPPQNLGGSNPGGSTDPGGGNTGGNPGGGNTGGNPGGGNTKPPVNSPEPGTFLSSVLGAGLLGWVRWRRRRTTANVVV